jgi:hypothetical protein
VLEGLVAIAALVVSASAGIVSCRATDISNRQATIAEAELEPVISATRAYTSRTAKAETTTVRNYGGPADSFDIDYVVFLSIEYASTPNKQPSTRVVPLTDYYGVSYSTGAPKGKLVEITSGTSSNNTAFGRLYEKVAKYGKQRSAYLYVDVVRFLRVEYVNRLGEKHTRYLTVEIPSGSRQISPAIGKRAFELEDKLSAQQVSIYTATPPEVVAAWRKGGSLPALR